MPNKPEGATENRLKDVELVGVETLSFIYREPPSPLEVDQFNVSTNVQLEWSDDAERFRTVTSVHATPRIDTGSFEVPEEIDLEVEELAEFELCFLANAVIYEPDDYGDYLSDGKPDFPYSMVVTMSQVSVDTTRGVLFEKLRGTYLDTLLLPYVDVEAMTEDLAETLQ